MANEPDIPTPNRASPETRRFVARRDAARAAMASDRERARAERDAEETSDAPNRIGFLLGLLVAAVLVIGGWVIIDQMRCNPLFSNLSFAQASSCE